MHKKSLILSIPVILAVLILSGWFIIHSWNMPGESEEEGVSGDYHSEIDSRVNTIDTTGWKVYENDIVLFKYPEKYRIIAEEIREGFIVFGTQERLDSEFFFKGEKEISETGFFISIDVTKLNIADMASVSGSKDLDSLWKTWVGRDQGGLGISTFQEVTYKGDEVIVIDGRGTGQIYKSEHVSRSYNIPNDAKNIIVEVTIRASVEEFFQFENVALGVIQTLQFR